MCSLYYTLENGVFGGSFSYGDVERGSTYIYQVCVWSLSLCRCVRGRVRIMSGTNFVYVRQARDIERCWFNVGSAS